MPRHLLPEPELKPPHAACTEPEPELPVSTPGEHLLYFFSSSIGTTDGSRLTIPPLLVSRFQCFHPGSTAMAMTPRPGSGFDGPLPHRHHLHLPPSGSPPPSVPLSGSPPPSASVRTVEVKRVTTVTTTEAQGGMAVEAKCATAVEQRPPSFTLRHNQWRRKSSLDGGPLLWKLNDGGHGSGRGVGPLPARR
jgi:hypothetical protein